MLTTRINNKTFLIGDKTYRAGERILLLDEEQKMLERLGELTSEINEVKPQMFDACHAATGVYEEALANQFFAYEQSAREFNYLVSSLMHRICTRIGGLMPLRIESEGAKGVFVREITDENESTVLTTEIVKRSSRFDRMIGDPRMLLAGLVGPTPEEGMSKVKIRSANWSLMGAPYATVKGGEVPFPMNSIDDLETISWSGDNSFEGSLVETAFMRALMAVLNSSSRTDQIRNGSWPFTSCAMIVGEREVLCLNTGELRTDQDRLNLLQREITRLGAKCLALFHFGQINKGGSTHDYDDEEMQKQPAIGFTMSLTMRSEKAAGLLMCAKSWRLIQTPQGLTMSICASFEGHPGIGDVNGKAMMEFVFANVNKPKLALVD